MVHPMLTTDVPHAAFESATHVHTATEASHMATATEAATATSRLGCARKQG
jgi:hypothetical protein